MARFSGSASLRFTAPVTLTNPITVSTAATISTGSNNVTLAGAIGGTTGLTKIGSGTLTYTANNTNTGSTTVTAGTLQLDYTTNDGTKLADGLPLTLAGGTLDLAGTNVTPHLELVGSTVVSANSSLTRSGATANRIALGAITSSGGSLNIAANSLATTTNTLTNGLLPSFITVGGAPATTNGSNEIIAATTSDVNRLGGQITSSAGSNVQIIEAGTSGNVTMASSGVTDIATLTNNGTVASTLVDIGSGNTLRLAAAGTIAAGTNGLALSNGTLTAGGADDTAGSVDVFNASANATNIDSAIADNGTGMVSLTKAGSGVLVLGGTNTYTGATTVNAGTLALSGGNAIPDTGVITLNNSGVLRLDNNETIAGLTGSASSNINLQANTLTWGDAASDTFPGIISGTGSLTKAGSGTVTLNGANTYTGGTTVSDGTLSARVTNGQNALGTGAVSVGATKILNLNNVNTANDTTVSNLFTGSGTVNLVFSAGTTARNTRINSAGALTGFSGALVMSTPGATGDKLADVTGVIPGSITIGSGTQLYISSASGVTFNGGITVSGTGNSETRGAIRLGTTLSGNITLAGDTTIGAEGGSIAGNITSSAGAPVALTVGTTNSTGSSTFSGNISDGASSVVSLTKATGTGTMTLSGTNTYSGATNITSGTLNLTGSNANSAVTLATGTTLKGEGSSAALTTSGTSNLVINPATEPAAFTTGALTLGGVMTVSFEGGAPPSSGSVRVMNYTGTDPLTANFALANAASYRNPQFTATGGQVNLSLGNTSLTWTAVGGSAWDVGSPSAGTTNWNDTTPAASKFYFGDAVTFNDTPGSNQTVTMAVDVQPSSITFNNTTYSYALTATSGKITGATGITKNGTNNVTLGGANGQNYTGAIAVNAGTLKMGSRDAFGLTSGITIANGAAVDINGQTPGSVATGGYTYTIAGTGVGGTGAITHTSTTYSGTNAGIKNLILADNASVGGNNERFDIGSANTAGTGGITGNGKTLTKIGTNLMGFHGNSSATPINIVISGGTAWAEADNAVGGVNGTVTVNSAAKFGSYGTRTIATPVTLNAGATLHNQGGGTGTWSGAIALADTSTIEAGTEIAISGSATLATSGSLAKTGGAQLTVTGTLNGNGGTLNHNAGTIQIGNLGATGSVTGFTTINLANGVLFRSRLSGANNTISSNFTFANASSEVRQHGGTTADTLTLTGTVGTDTTKGILRSTFGKLVLGSGASATVNFVGIQGDATSGRGVIEVKSGASLTSPWLNIGQEDGQCGILNITGGTVTGLTGGNGGNNALRVGHWNNNSSTVPSELNVSAGTLDASATNLTTSIGWNGYGIMTVGGGASPALAKVYAIQLDANGDSGTYNDTVTLLPNGTLEVGAGGAAGASANDYFILNGGTIKGVANSTWSARMDVTASTTSFASANSGIVVTGSGSLTGTGTLEKNGLGTLVLTGGTFGGTLTSTGGTLHLGTTAWTAATVTSAAGGAIQPGTPATAGAVSIPTLTLNGGSPTFRANYNGGAYGDRFLVTGSNAFTVATPTVLTVIPGSDLFVGDKIPIIDYTGTIGGASGFAGLSATAAGNPHFSLSLEDDTTNTLVNVVIDSLDSVIWKGNINGTWDVNTTSNWETVSDTLTSKFYDLDAVKFTDDVGAGATTITLTGTIRPSSMQFDATVDYTLQGDPITGPTGLVKNNTGSVTLLNNNTNTGTVAINSGTVTVGNGGTTGALGGTGAITLAGALEFHRSDSVTLDRAAAGTGTLRKKGAGTLLANNSTTLFLPTNLVVENGTMQITTGAFSGNRMTGSGLVTVGTGGTLILSSAHSLGGDNGGISEAFAITGGTLTVNGEQYIQNLTLNGGTINGSNEIRVPSSNNYTVTGSAPSTIAARVSMGFSSPNWKVEDVTGSSAADLTISGQVVNVYALTKTGVGTMVLTGNNTYTGGTNANGGTLSVASVADAGGTASIGVYTTGNPGYLGIANDSTFRYTGTGSESTARNLWIDTGAQTKTIEITNASASVTFTGTAGNINKPFKKTGDGSLTIADVMNAGTEVTVDGGKLTLGGTNTYTGDTTVNAGGTLVVDGDSIANGGALKINGTGKTEVTNTEIVDTLWINGSQMAAGTYGATGSGATNIDDTHFAGAGVVQVATGPAGYDSWALQIADSGQRDRTDDPDGDGFTNLQEFLFGKDPEVSDGALTTTEHTGGNLVIRWSERTTGATYKLMESATLANPWSQWSGTPATDGSTVDTGFGIYQPMKATITIGSGKDFFRVEGVEN